MSGRRGLALLITIAILAVFLLGFIYIDLGWKTSPVERAKEQNSGVNAPAEQAPPAGTHEDPEGNTKLPAGQQ